MIEIKTKTEPKVEIEKAKIRLDTLTNHPCKRESSRKPNTKDHDPKYKTKMKVQGLNGVEGGRN